jgi:hypothetical protein
MNIIFGESESDATTVEFVSDRATARLVKVFTAFYARYYTGWTPERFREEIAKNVYDCFYSERCMI